VQVQKQIDELLALRVRLEDLRREVDLGRGEALFQVAHDLRRPFRVHTRAGLVEAVGTQFNVYDRVNGDTRVSVLEGKVRAMWLHRTRRASECFEQYRVATASADLR
jgi:ferric-dicitrate binding protein FerR (iron transport regulator)